MSRTDWDIDPQSLTVPPFAAPGTAHMVIGPDVPADLQAWVTANFLQHVYFAQLGYDVTGGYLFSAYCYSDAIQIPEKINGYMTSASVPHLFGVEGWNIPGNSPSYSIGAPVYAGEVLSVYSPVDFITTNRADLRMNGRSYGRGMIGWVTTNVAGPATGAGENQTLGIVATIKNGRAYQVSCGGQILTSVANQAAFILIRRTNTAGPLLWNSGFLATFTTVANHYQVRVVIINSSGADITDNVLQDIVRAVGAGTVQNFASAQQPTWMRIDDIGAASDYSGAQQF